MYCYNCGKEISDDVQFCPYCGARTQEDAKPSVSTGTPSAPVAAGEEQPPKVWSVFALVSKILGIVCLCASVIPYLNYFSFAFSIGGIVFACLGKKAKNEVADKNCNLGLKLSIAALVVSFVLMIVYTVVFVVVLGEFVPDGVYDTYY